MANTASIISKENGLLYAHYTDLMEIDHFSHKVNAEAKATLLPFSQTWVNGQPAQYLKNFKSEILTEERVKSYSIIQTALFLTIPTQADISVKVKLPNKSEKNFSLRPNLTVEGLKKMVEKEFNIQDFELEDGLGQTLNKQTEINEVDLNSDLVVVFKSSLKEEIVEEETSGLEVSLNSIDFVAFTNPKYLKFSKSAPPGRVIDAGLNLEGNCTKCTPNNEYKVIAKFGISYPEAIFINRAKEKACCPLCSGPLKNVNNCILFDCFYSIDGVMMNQEKFTETKAKAPNDKPLTFRDILPVSRTSAISKWKSLTITTEAVPHVISPQVKNTTICKIL